MKKSKQELMDEATKLANSHELKKEVIMKIFSDLDKEEEMSSKHIEGIATVNELLTELNELEEEHEKVLAQIKGK